MTQIWTEKGSYKSAPYKSEADLESAIELVQHELFGPDRILLHRSGGALRD